MSNKITENETKFLLYKTDNNQIKVDVLIQDETVWLTQQQMPELFQKSRSTINEHIKNIYMENELTQEDSMKKFGNFEFAKKPTNYYNLDGFLQFNEKEILHHKGRISHEVAVSLALDEYEKYRVIQDREYLSDFDKLLLEMEKYDED
jgi:hypothetical protein